MQRVEMVGVSGVGKTTLYQKIVQVPEEERSYLTLKEAYKLAALSHDISIKDIKLRFYQTVLNLGILDSKAWGIGRTILFNSLNKNGCNFCLKDIEPFWVSYSILLEYLKGEERRDAIFNRIARFDEKVQEYLILKNYLSKNLLVLVDEGINHCHPGITEYGIQNYSMEEIKGDYAFNPHGIIYCKQSADIIFNQSLERKRKGILTFTHGSMEKKELRIYVERSIAKHERKVRSYKEIGIPVLEINPRNNFDGNMQKICEFISNIST